jgi:ribosome biogenesis GTPase
VPSTTSIPIGSSVEDLGFYPFFSTQFEQLADHQHLVPARITLDNGILYRLGGCRCASGELSGRLRHELTGPRRPTTGDWVLVDEGVDRAIIQHVFDRRTTLRRRTVQSEYGVQVVAANVDVFFVVTSANRDLNPRRIERYLTAVGESGARAVIVLNKVDLVPDPAPLVALLEPVALGTQIVPVSARDGSGLAALRGHVQRGVTVGLVGSSGVGKSTLTNALIGAEVQATHEIREDGKGRHTTTGRELLLLPAGGILIDTPGMREFGLVDEAEALDDSFADIAALAAQCRFGDCRHGDEPGCAVQDAARTGALARERLESFQRLERELEAAAVRGDKAAASAQRRKWKTRSRQVRALTKQLAKREE